MLKFLYTKNLLEYRSREELDKTGANICLVTMHSQNNYSIPKMTHTQTLYTQKLQPNLRPKQVVIVVKQAGRFEMGLFIDTDCLFTIMIVQFCIH